MNDTDNLIQQLVARAEPVRRLATPWRRTVLWAAFACGIIALMVVDRGPRPDLLPALRVPGAMVEWIASVLTGMLAAFAAFQISVPGRSPSWAWLPLPAALLWFAGLGWGCLRDIGQRGIGALAFHGGGWECAWAIALTSLPLGLVLLLMVRHAGVVRPAPTALLTALSAAALSAAGVALIHEGESALMAMIWHAGAVTILSALCWLAGRQLFAWIGYARR